MKKFLILITLLLPVLAMAQTESRSVRKGNRAFRREKFSDADVEYRRGLNVDTTSARAAYNLANALYREQSFDEAAKYMDQARRHLPEILHPKLQQEMAHHSAYNAGDIALQKKDYQKAVQAFMEALVVNPDDMDAKENYLYARKMLQNQQQGGGGENQNQDQQQNQDQDQNQNQDQQQNQDKQDQNQQQDQDKPEQQQQPQEQEISPQQAQQMLQAIQAKEKDTQDKVKKEKAAALRSRQKEKNW